MKVLHESELDKIEEFIRVQAERFIAGRDCSFELLRNYDLPNGHINYKLKFLSGNRTQQRKFVHTMESEITESLDIMVQLLTHMAVDIGLIETTEKQMTHRVTVMGSEGANTEIQIDGHTLRGLYELKYEVDAAGAPRVTMGFSRSYVHLDQDFLPENMAIKIQGFDELLDVATRLTEWQRNKFKIDTYALAVSDDESRDLWQELHDTLHTYTPLEGNSPDGPKVH